MTLGTLIGRSLRFYWRTHLGTVAGVALAAAILTGALVVGGSVRFTLEQLAIARIGLVTQALSMPEHFFRSRLADDLSSEIHSPVAPVLQARGSVVLPDGRARANDVQVLGVDDRFWQLGRAQNYGGLKGGVISARLAEQLGVRAGDTIIVRVEMPAAVSRDAPMSGNSDASVALRIRLTAVAGDKEFGRFSLRANQVPPCTVFVPLALLQDQLKHEAQANMLLTSAAADANPALRKVWTLADAGLELHDNPLELRSDRVFLNPAITKPLISAGGVGVLTYFANEFRHGAKTTPYSFIAAVGSDQGNDEITISSWLADDLGAQAGDELVLRYYVIGERRELVERDATFRVRAITPIAKDDSWMPAFPGLADARSCREWDPGIPIDTGRIRQKDEDYWNGFRGTPKAFVTLAAGQKLWANRFGNLTAIRFPAGTDVAAIIHSKIDPAALGFFFSPVSEPAMNSSRGAMDFGQLFLGFSLFLIVAAIILTAMLVQLAQRTAESALLRTLGFPLSKIRRLILGEGLAIALVGTGLGVLGGVVYTKLALLGLSTLWRGAVGAAHFRYHAEPWTLALGAGASLAVSVLTVWLVQRRQMRNVPADLLAAGRARRPPRWAMGLVIGSCVVALALLPLKNAEAFFSAGAFLLISGIAFSYWWMPQERVGSR